MTRRTEFTASIQSEVCFAETPSPSRRGDRYPELSDGNVENSVTILRLVRSFTSSFYGDFESSQIGEGVAGSALALLCSLELFVC
jgi:hypothetical protein